VPISTQDRGVLKELIDNAVQVTPALVAFFRDTSPSLGIKSESDFVFGFVQGLILGQYRVYRKTMPDGLSDDRLREASRIVARRGKEIREAILRAG
jgi:hypothetical protein